MKFTTLKEAKAAGYVAKRPQDYGGEQIELKGHTLIKGRKEAISRTAWKKLGYTVKAGAQPQAMIRRSLLRAVVTYAVYRDDQVVPVSVLEKTLGKEIANTLVQHCAHLRNYGLIDAALGVIDRNKRVLKKRRS